MDLQPRWPLGTIAGRIAAVRAVTEAMASDTGTESDR